jgi:integrase
MSKRDDFRLFQRGGTWYARKRRKGREFETPLDTADKSLGRERAKRWVERLRAEEWGEKPARAFDEAMTRYAEERFGSLADKTKKRYAASIEHLHRHFQGMPLAKITASTLMDFERKRRQEVKAPTVRRDLSVLSSIFVMAQLWEWAETNPVRPFMEARGKMGLTEGEARTRYLTRDEEDALLRYAGDAFRHLFAFDIDTGLRRGELMALSWRHVKLDIPNEDLIPARGHIIVEKKRTRTKGGSRIVPLVDRAYDYLRHAGKRGLVVFPTSDGQPYSKESPTVWEALKKAARKAGIDDLTFHDLRRTCGCRLLQDYGASMEVVSRWLGHSSIAVTERCYAFLRIEDLHRAVEKGRENVIQIAAKRAQLKASGDK